jgi:catechol 2,3-dioxygenase-like lactoylglutathione lyase family enzyme
MYLEALDHVNIETDHVDRSADFYENILGMTRGPRPEFDRPGHWMYINGSPIVHIIRTGPWNEQLTGSKDAAISHFAMRITDFDKMKAHLDGNDIEYRFVQVPGSTMRQMFFNDPDGVMVELLHIPEGAREALSA